VARAGRGDCRWAEPVCTVNFLFFQKFSNGFKLEMVKDGLLCSKFSYKICMFRELNKEQLSPLEVFKIRNVI
jgi:hypothetical protein